MTFQSKIFSWIFLFFRSKVLVTKIKKYRAIGIIAIETSAYGMRRRKRDERMHDPRTMNRICGSTMLASVVTSFSLYLTLTERVLTARRRWKSRAVGYRSLRTRYICIIPYQVRLELSSNLI